MKCLMIVLSLLISTATLANGSALNPRQMEAVVNELKRLISDNSEDIGRGGKLAHALQGLQFADRFLTGLETEEFVRVINDELQSTSHDKHLLIRFDDDAMHSGGGDRGPPAPRPRMMMPPEDTHVFGRVAMLANDVAYMEILGFGCDNASIEELETEFAKVDQAKALILDVRATPGGSPECVALVSSFLFAEGPKLINSIYSRVDQRTDEFRTTSTVRNKLSPSSSVFVLTSKRTFSAAEEFAYDLQAQKRATIVGERTAGAANPGRPFRLPAGFSVFIPIGRVINPITHSNWEQVGVNPDFVTSAFDALDEALQLAKRGDSVAGRHDDN